MAGESTYDFGECTWYVASTLPWVEGGWGNAADWAASAAAAGFAESLSPQVGAVVVYAAGAGYSEFGHVAIVRAVYGDGTFLVSEMNYVSWDQVDERVSTMWDVATFILPPAGTPPLGGGSSDSGGGQSNSERVALSWSGLAQMVNQDLPSLTQYVGGLAAQLQALATP